eukprot:COSAG02_NODE_1497_length_12282_cov_757.962571_7_plen_170_part_01
MWAHTRGRPASHDVDVDAQRAAARKLLGVAADATPKQLQEAYTREALRWHPDRHAASAAVEEAAGASLRFQEASDALALLLQAEAERTGTKTWVYNGAQNCWEWGVAGTEQQHMRQPEISTYDGTQGFSPSQSYRPPWADSGFGQHASAGEHQTNSQNVHDGAWWDPSWD